MLFLTLFLGIFLNALGYIPPGNINLTVAQLSINKGMRQAWSFILSFSCVEVFFTFGMMRFARWLSSDVNLDANFNQVRIGTYIDAFMVMLFLIMGTLTWINRNKLPKAKDNNSSKKGSVLYGMLLGILNPVQIPFWLFFGNYVILHEWIQTDYLSLVVFSLGSGMGSGLALYGYSYFARYIQEKFALSSHLINKSIAIFLWALALYLIIKQVVLYLR
ncbi:LysE family transporter [Pedobacter psychroterrae]|uniref:Lysine transporter LysE n=1 Tax=Pedobacter psychroterrae TaxID=2530453 RepID=A0A4R0NCC7_9SPHI|nr:LysE family transporter [Pedobacter psychroterrae]TCC97981.1 lysine transporter LysE [Pedobacter psychroterrae]